MPTATAKQNNITIAPLSLIGWCIYRVQMGASLNSKSKQPLHCIKLDTATEPPYNTGAKDWKYNNDYVDGTDSYRHSKWLSFMEKRLKLTKKLLSQDGAIITTIDDNEYAHLQLLIDEVFPEAYNVVLSIQMNPGGTQGKAFSVTNEYAIITYFKKTTVYKKQHSGGETYNLRRWGSTSNRYEGATCFLSCYSRCKK